MISQRINYHNSTAAVVYFVWGVNGWQDPPEAWRPKGSFERLGLFYSPMKRNGTSFEVTLTLPSQTVIDYCFKITRNRNGAAIAEWDRDHERDDNFHSRVTGEDVKIHSEAGFLQSKGVENPVELRLTLIAVLFVLGATRMGLCRVFGRAKSQQRDLTLFVKRSITLGLGMYLLMLLIRSANAGYMQMSWSVAGSVFFDVLLMSYYDLIFVGALVTVCNGLFFLARRKHHILSITYGFFVLAAVMSVIIAFLNIYIVQKLGTPFNYPWLYYSDFLKTRYAQEAVLSNISWEIVSHILLMLTALFMFSGVLRQLTDSFPLRSGIKRPLAVACLLVLVLYFPVAGWALDRNYADTRRVENPITFFIKSIFRDRPPLLYTMDVSDADFLPNAEASAGPIGHIFDREPAVRNVILFVLESVPAQYLEPYGGAYPVNPELRRYLSRAMIFDNVYTHIPSSNKALISMLCGIYPWVSYRSLTYEYPEIDIPTLSSELKKAGFRTGFFTSGDNRFQRMNVFLAERGFDDVFDSQNLDCDDRVVWEEIIDEEDMDKLWEHPESVNDHCMVDAFTEWQAEKGGRPFFAMLWNVQTHYPYVAIGEEIDFDVEYDVFNRYLNSLHQTDAVLGSLLQSLESNRLLDSTLVIIVGDHGEAFGQHQQYGHGSNLYEENIHVPLILINPLLFKGERSAVVGGHIDLAPTVLSMLNLPAPVEWQGQSLFRANRTDRVFFFSPWSSFLFGYRQEDFKFIVDALQNKNEIYHLAEDPDELINLGLQRPDLVPDGHRQIAAWVQHHDKLMMKLISAR